LSSGVTKKRLQTLDISNRMCDKYNTMSENTISHALRTAITESGKPLLRISNESGVARGSLIRFLRGDQSLRLDKADILADYFGLKIVKQEDK